MKKTYSFLFLLAYILQTNFAQKTITADEAVCIALKNNFGILVAYNEADMARINNTAGNAGMLPNITVTGSNDLSINKVHQKNSDGSETNHSNAHTNTLQMEALLNWTLFDGGKMFVTKSKLNEMEALGELQYKEKLLQTIYDVIASYYNIVRQKQQLSSINNVILYNEERVKITQTSYSTGLSPKTNLLQAKIDLNVYLENAISQQYIINAAKRNLNQLLGRSIDSTSFDVIDSILLDYTPNRDEIIQKLRANNPSVLTYQKQMTINNLTVKALQAGRLPKLNFYTGYDFLQKDYTKSATITSRTNGPFLGASISIPIFQSGNINRQVSIAKIELKSSEYALENVKIEMDIQLQDALTDFESQQSLLVMEQENSLLAKENLEISMQRLRFGQTTSLEVRQAQEDYENSLTRLINFKYNLKIAETKLKQLIAEL
jgi:outer membrane protein TolC